MYTVINCKIHNRMKIQGITVRKFNWELEILVALTKFAEATEWFN